MSIVFFSRIAPTPVPTPDTPGAAPTPRSTYRETLADRPVRTLVTLQFVTIFAMALGTSFVPNFLADQRGLAPATITALGAAGAFGSFLFGLAVTRVVRLQRAPFFGIALATIFVATTLTTFATAHAFWLIALAFFPRGGFFSAWSLFVAALGDIVDERHRGRSFALSEMLGGAAFSFAPMLAGALYAVRPVLPLVTSVAAIVCLLPVLLRAQRGLAKRRLAVAVPQVEAEPA
jgi:MFS family permease